MARRRRFINASGTTACGVSFTPSITLASSGVGGRATAVNNDLKSQYKHDGIELRTQMETRI